MKQKYEVAEINDTKITIDVSMLASDEMFFNATEIAKQFEKRPGDFLKTEYTKSYIQALAKSDGCCSEDISTTYVRVKNGGKYR